MILFCAFLIMIRGQMKSKYATSIEYINLLELVLLFHCLLKRLVLFISLFIEERTERTPWQMIELRGYQDR